MIDTWQRHFAWRFMPTKAAWRRFHNTRQSDRRAEAEGLGLCTRCHGPRDSAHYKRCQGCRKSTATLERRRALRNQAKADGTACTKCGNHNRDAGRFKLCPLCRERARDVAARQRMKHAT